MKFESTYLKDLYNDVLKNGKVETTLHFEGMNSLTNKAYHSEVDKVIAEDGRVFAVTRVDGIVNGIICWS